MALQAYYNCMSGNLRTLVSPQHQFTSITNRVLAYLTVLRLISAVWVEISENLNLRHFSAQVSQIVFFAYLNALPLITTIWAEMSENSYLLQFRAQVPQIVFSIYLTALPLIKTLCVEISENSYLRDFSAQVSQIVFLAYLTVLRLFRFVRPEMSENLYLRHLVHKYHNWCFLLIWPFYGYSELDDLNCHKTHISAISVHRYQKSCF